MKQAFTYNSRYFKHYGSWLILLFFLIGIRPAAHASIVVTIPATPGTDTTFFTPTNRKTDFSASRMLFSSSEIGNTGTISQIAFQKESGSTSISINYISIYMRETASATLTTGVPASYTSFAVSGYRKVYNTGPISNSMTNGWTTITLSKAVGDIMTYSGGSNYLDILIVKESIEPGTSSFPIYYCHATTGPVSAYYYGASALGSSFTGTTTKRPNIQLTFESSCAGKPATGTITGPVTAVCSGSAFTLNPVGLTIGTGMHYQWQSRNSGSSTFADMAATDTFATLTTSTTTDKDYRIVSTCVLSGQSDVSDPFAVKVLTASSISASSAPSFCVGGSVILTTSTVSGTTSTWLKDGISTGITGSSYTATSAATYSVKVSSVDCPAGIVSNTITVSVNPLPVVSVTALSSTTFCNGSHVDLQATSGTGLYYQWQKDGVDIPGANSSLYPATAAGAYRVRVTNTLTGCNSFSAAITVTVNPVPLSPVISGAGGKTSFCSSDNLLLSSIPTSGIIYQWEDVSGPIAGATSTTYIATSANTYTLKATLGSCFVKSNALVITENPLPPASITPSGSVSFCNGDSLKIVAGTTTGVSYKWLESGVPIPGAANSPSYFAKSAGVYSVMVTNTATGCNDKSPALTINLITPVEPLVTASGPATFCMGGSVTLNATVGTGLTTEWQESGSNIPGEVSASFTTSMSGEYRIKVTNGYGCAAYSMPIKVTVNGLPLNTLTLKGGSSICNGTSSSILAPVIAGYTYQWENTGVPLPGETANPYYATTPGTYSVLIKDSNGCSSTSAGISITVKYVKPFYVHTYGNTFFCEGDQTKLATQSGFTSYQWYLDGVYIPGATDTFIYAAKKGKYSVKVQDPANSCYATSNGFNILVIPSPDTPFITQAGSRLSTSVKDVVYQWYKDGIAITGAKDSFIISSGDAVYAVVVTNEAGCSKRATINLNSSGIAAGISKTYYIKVFPNPVRDKLNIEAPEGITISLTDLQGRCLFLQKDAKNIEMRQFSAGIYLLQFIDENNQVVGTEKVAKVD